jgi:hypothetical protein
MSKIFKMRNKISISISQEAEQIAPQTTTI